MRIFFEGQVIEEQYQKINGEGYIDNLDLKDEDLEQGGSRIQNMKKVRNVIFWLDVVGRRGGCKDDF